MENRYPDPTQSEQDSFAFRLYFGPGDDYLDLIIRRAYRDLNRTVHGVGGYPDAFQNATAVIRRELEFLRSGNVNPTVEKFDDWHQTLCRSLCDTYSSHGYQTFYIGQAQKWVNMALKYVYVFGESKLPGFAAYYSLCHVSIDNIVFDAPAFKGLASFREPWSRLNDYSAYMLFQTRVRERYPESAPLAVEFFAWQGVNPASAND